MIYLDNAATSFPKAPGVAEALVRVINSPVGNPGRSSHSAGRQADKILFETRELLAQLFMVDDSSRFIFTANATQALNTVVLGYCKNGVGPVLVSSMEHNSVMRPLRYLEERYGVRVETFASLEESGGYPDIVDFENKIKHLHPRMVVSSGASNVSGVVFPVRDLCRIARENGIPICIDGAQLAGEAIVDLGEWRPDFFCFSGHKGLLGPSGTGGFYIADPGSLDPLMFGGTGSRSSQDIQPEFLPDKFESGTPNIVGVAGLNAALKFLLEKGVSELADRRDLICRRLIKGLCSQACFKVIGDRDKYLSTAIVSLSLCDSPGQQRSLSELTEVLDTKDVAVRMGYHCAPGAHRSLKTFESGGTIRFSPGCFTTNQEIDQVIDILTGK